MKDYKYEESTIIRNIPCNEYEKFIYDTANMEYNLIRNLVIERKRKNLTQKDISNITGLSQQAVSRMERFGNKPSLFNLLKYLKALNLDINTIFKDIT